MSFNDIRKKYGPLDATADEVTPKTDTTTNAATGFDAIRKKYGPDKAGSTPAKQKSSDILSLLLNPTQRLPQDEDAAKSRQFLLSPVVRDAEALRAQQEATRIQVQKDISLRQKYSGLTYSQLNDKLNIMPKDTEEYEWLSNYAPTVMTAADYDAEISSTSAQITNLEAVLEEYNRLTKQVSTQNPDAYANVRLAEIRKQYGSSADIEAEVENLKAKRYNYENSRKYGFLHENADFAEKSKPTQTSATGNYFDYLFQNGKFKYDFINGLTHVQNNGTEAEQKIAGFFDKNLSYMSNDEKAIYNYLYNTQSADAADDYLKSLESVLGERASNYTLEEWTKAAKEAPLGASIASVPLKLWGGVGYVDSAAQKAIKGVQESVTGEYAGPVNYNSAAMMPSKLSNAMRATVAEGLADEYGTIQIDEQEHPVLGKVLNGKSVGDVYQLGMSMVDSAAVAVLSAATGVNCSVLLAGDAATQQTLSAVKNGANDEQALTMGLLAGGFEWLFEKYELDQLLGADNNVLKAIVNQAITEAAGEGATSISNMIADTLVMAEKSDWRRSIADYMKDNPGMTEEEAAKLAFMDAAIQVGWDTVGGAVSGGIMGGGSSGIKNVNATSTTQQPQSAPISGEIAADAQFQAEQETAATPKPGSLEWVQHLNELGKSKDGQTSQQKQSPYDRFKEIVDLGANKQKNTVQMNGNKYHLRDYTQEQKDNWRNSKRIVLYEGIEQFKNFIKNALTGKIQTNKKLYFGAVDSDLASAISAATGVDVEGYNLALGENEIRKINKDHGNEQTEAPRGQRAVTEADYLNIPNVVQSPDSIKLSSKLYEGKPVVEFRKISGNETTVVSAVVSDKRLDLFVQTTFVNKKRGSIATPESEQADSNTPKATGGTAPKDASLGDMGRGSNNRISHGASSDASINSISETTPGVNNDSDKSKAAKVLTESPKFPKAKRSLWSWVKEGVFDKGMVFETLALKTKNRELQAKWNSTRYAQSRAQWLIGNGAENTKSLNAIREEVESTGKTKQFSEYLYHKHNIDRMQLQTRYKGAKNKPVFGDAVTAEVSQRYVEQYEQENPSFVQLAEDVYAYMNHLRQLMVDDGIISQDTASLWAQMYPHYVPIQREESSGRSVDVPLDTGRTGVNAPVKKATGGNNDILPLFDTMAQRTIQTYTAIARNSFGMELKNTLGSVVSKGTQNVDEAISSVDAQESLLQEGKNGTNPTFTVFENGERVTFEVTEEMYDALKPKSEVMSYTNTVTNAISNFHRGVLTEYNPTFLLTNAIKDVQDVLINSQHPAKTYAKIPKAYVELAQKGKWYTEYVAHGGEQNTYFNSETNTFESRDKGLKKLQNMPPLSTISKLNSFIEMAPRLAEYIASREAGRSVDVAMLDAARVTTNFAAGGDLTKLLNRNGATFLNASVQGAVQQVRNVREAKMNGLKGWAGLAGRFILAGLPAVLLNGLIWKDDEDYEELSDYVKDNYYIVWKYGDGQFVKIPKGRTTAVIQNAFEQIGNAVTGDDEVDLQRFIELVVSNLAPNNPIDNNILSPVFQTANNETWYGEDLVPARLQDLPAAEQYDESTDALSKWLGEKLNVSPVKINYLLNQYGGGIADTFLPMLTPEAESGDNSLVGNILAPLKDKFTTDSVMNNQNVTDFYDKLDELTTNAKASGAAVEDQILYKYMNSVNSKLRNLYAKKRQVQSSDLPDDQKYAQVRSIQQEITDAAQKALKACSNPYSADKSGMVAGVIGDSFSDLADCWKNGADATTAIASIEKAYEAYTKMDDAGKESVKAEGGRVTDYLVAREIGLSNKTFVDLYETFYGIDNADIAASAKASQWSYALEKAQEKGTITASQKNALKEEMNFWQMIPAETERFDSLTASGLSADKADYVTRILSWIKPETGSSSVKPIQRIEAIANADDKLTQEDQEAAMKSVLDDRGYAKYLRVLALGLDTDDYAGSYRMYLDAEGKGKKERTIAQYQKDLGVSYSVAKSLYEIYCPPAK